MQRLRASVRGTTAGYLWRATRALPKSFGAGETVVSRRRRVRPQPSFRFFAVVGAWYEGDIIGACVANARAQGCEEVFLVDNDSPDDTVDAAVAAGATLAASYRTPSYSEQARIGLMNAVVEHTSALAGDEHVWWLWLDADELPHGPNGTTLVEHLRGLDRDVRVVGARAFDHYPTTTAPVPRDRHPIDVVPKCAEEAGRFRARCPAGHYKHPLQRFDRDGPRIIALKGFHRVRSTVRLLEAPEPVFIQHFPFRNEEATRARLGALVRADDGDARITAHEAAELAGSKRGSTASRRYAELDAIYDAARTGVPYDPALAPWPDAVGAEHGPIARWY
jgi:hypothetical protein